MRQFARYVNYRPMIDFFIIMMYNKATINIGQ